MIYTTAMDSLNLTPKTARVIKIFLEDPARPRYGFELMRLSRLPSGTLYPILARLQAAGWLIGAHENIDPHAEGRPRRRTYIITDEATSEARMQLAALSEELRPPSLRPSALRPQGEMS
jgi:PadR family transcriptional regulator PadR